MSRIARRTLSLILVLLMAASAGLSVFAEGVPDDGMTAPQRKFHRTVLPYVFALSCAYVGISDTGAVKTPDKMWDAMGWYTAYKYLETGTDYLTAHEAAGFQEAVYPGGNMIDCPQRLLDCGVVEKDYLGGPIGNVFYFPYHIAFAENLLDNAIELKTEYAGIRKIAAELTLNIPGETVVYNYSFTFRPNDVKVSKALKQFRPTYVINKICVSISDAAAEAEELSETSIIDSLLRRRNSIRAVSESPDRKTVTLYYIRNNATCMLARTKFSDGTSAVNGIFKNFVYKKDKSTDNRVFAYSDLRGGTDFCANLGSESMIINDTLFLESEGEKNSVYGAFVLGKEGLECFRYTIDKSTLLCRKAEWCTFYGYQDYSENGEATGNYDMEFDYANISYEYNVSVDDSAYIDCWNLKLRTVTVVYIIDEADSADRYEYRVSMPYNWEYLPIEAVENPGIVYLDAACQREYSYPGNSTDYTVYVKIDG
ncbi:MAG TPA: hypothetical protein GX704_01530 [Clostridiales bacterium]|nr:hypothetical protein [Clostridiales bacterium]